VIREALACTPVQGETRWGRPAIGFSYFVFGADSADALAPVVAKLAGR